MSRRPTAASLGSSVTTTSAGHRARIVRTVLAAASVFVLVLARNSVAGMGQNPVDLASGIDRDSASAFSPLAEVLKLVVAAVVGAVVMAVHRRYPGDKPISRSLAQAQVLLCVAGALMMIIIGNSLARALGIAGGATIVRFRTPVEDPKDTTVLFLLLGLGMASGLGSFAVAGMGAAFLCLCLAVLDFVGERKQRTMILEMVASGSEFPTEYVSRLLAAYRIRCEPREVDAGKKATVRYFCYLDADTPLQRLSEQLMDPEAGSLKSVVWETPKRD
jgi:uncharacterized protein DUF4956